MLIFRTQNLQQHQLKPRDPAYFPSSSNLKETVDNLIIEFWVLKLLPTPGSLSPHLTGRWNKPQLRVVNRLPTDRRPCTQASSVFNTNFCSWFYQKGIIPTRLNLNIVADYEHSVKRLNPNFCIFSGSPPCSNHHTAENPSIKDSSVLKAKPVYEP